jgi:hypothetical protein
MTWADWIGVPGSMLAILGAIVAVAAFVHRQYYKRRKAKKLERLLWLSESVRPEHMEEMREIEQWLRRHSN